MKNRTKIILLVVLAIILVGLLVRSIMMMKEITPVAKRRESKKVAGGVMPTATTAQPTPIASPTPQRIANLSLALPPRNPFTPLVSERKPAPSSTPSAPPPKLPAPVIIQRQVQGQPTSLETATSLALLGTVLGPRNLAIVKVGEKSVIVREKGEIDGYILTKVERGKAVFHGKEGTLILYIRRRES
ncbi:MAG: hypothetical protein ACP5KZ_07235 [bacterium]